MGCTHCVWCIPFSEVSPLLWIGCRLCSALRGLQKCLQCSGWSRPGAGVEDLRVAAVLASTARSRRLAPAGHRSSPAAWSGSGSGTVCSRPKGWSCCPAGPHGPGMSARRPSSAGKRPSSSTSSMPVNMWLPKPVRATISARNTDCRSAPAVAESACKQIVGSRFNRAGCRWSKAGVNALLAIKSCVENNRRINFLNCWARCAQPPDRNLGTHSEFRCNVHRVGFWCSPPFYPEPRSLETSTRAT